MNAIRSTFLRPRPTPGTSVRISHECEITEAPTLLWTQVAIGIDCPLIFTGARLSIEQISDNGREFADYGGGIWILLDEDPYLPLHSSDQGGDLVGDIRPDPERGSLVLTVRSIEAKARTGRWILDWETMVENKTF